MIVTPDASILVRATKRSSGPARRVKSAVTFYLGEVGRVLSYPRMQALYRLTGDEIHDHIRFLKSVSRLVEPVIGLPVVLSDPADDPVIYTAVAAGAVLCVKDRDFFNPNVVAFCKRQDIEVMDDLSLL